MSFTHPWAIWIGVIAAATPVLIHWLTRPRPTRVPLSTLRFVLEAVQQRRSRNRLRDWLVLLIRTAAVLLIALAVARPRLGHLPAVSDNETGDAVRVVVLDVSQSMASRDGAARVLQRGRSTAAPFLRYRPGLGVNLILAGAQPHAAFQNPSTNFEALRDALASAEALPERLDVRRTLESAAEMLMPVSPEDQRRRELVLISDFQRGNWARADFSVLPEGTQIHLESVAPESQPDNCAVLQVSARALEIGGKTVQLEAHVGNFTASRELLALEVSIGEQTWRFDVDCLPGRATTVVEELELRDSGWQTGSARLAGVDDSLPADNSRQFVVQLRGTPTYALITRQPARQRPSSSHYLECALIPDSQREASSSAELLRINPDRIDVAALGSADLILLAKPGRLSTESIRLLSELLRRGRPMLYVAADTSDAQNLAGLVGDGAGMWRWAFLPPKLQDHEQVYQQLWNGLVRWLACSAQLMPSQKAAISVPKITFGTIESVAADLVVRQEALEAGTPTVRLTEMDGGAPTTVTPIPSGTSPGQFRAVFGQLSEGRYRAEVLLPGQTAPATQTAFDVRHGNLREVLELTARVDLMQTIAEESGGVVLEPFVPEKLAEQFDAHLARSRPARIVRREAWDRAWVLLAALGLWAVSWGLRRQSGLV